MKVFVAVVVLCSLAVAVQGALSKEDKKAAFLAVAEPCKAESGATDADFEALMKMEPAGSMEAKCLGACIFKKFKMMDSNGKFVKEVAMKFAELHTDGNVDHMKIAEEMIDICKDIPVSDNHCEASEEYGKCMKDEATKRGITSDQF